VGSEQSVRVNAICPGHTFTGINRQAAQDPERVARWIAKEPIGRFAVPEEIAEAAVWLCSAAASFVTGHAMAVDGGYVAV